jgi:hypothetical protein
MLVPDGNRRPLFAPPVRTSGSASPGDELLAFLGRLPRSAIQAPQLTSDSWNRTVGSNRLTIE